MDNLGVAMNDTAIGAYAVSKGINKSTAEMTSQEKIGLAMQMFMEKTAKYAGNYAKENDTLAGSLGTAKSALKNFMATGENIDAVISSGMQFAKVAGKMAKELGPKLLKGLMTAVKELAPKIPGIMDSIGSSVAQAIDDTFGTHLKGAWDGFSKGFGEVAGAIGEVISVIADTFSSFGRMAGKIIDKFFGGKKANVFDNLSKSVKVFLDFVANMGLDNLDKLLNFENSDAFKGILNSAQQFGNFVSKSLVPMISQAWDAIKEYTNILVEFWTGTFSGDDGIGSSIMNAFQSIIDVALPILLDAFSFIKDMLTQLKTFWDENGASIVEAVKIVFQHISQQIQEVMNFLQPFIQAAWEVIKIIIETAMGLIQGVIKVVTGLIRGDWSQVWEGIKQIFSSVWDGIKSIVDTAINLVKSIISNTWNTIKSITSSVWESIKSAITTPIEAAKEKVQSVVDDVKNILRSLGDIDLFEIGKNVIQGLIDGIGSMTKAVGDKISEVAGGIKDKITGALDIHSPSRWMRDMVGKNMMLGWGIGIDNNSGAAFSAVSNVLSGIKDSMRDGLNKGLKSEFNTVKSTVYDLTNLIANGADKINTELSNFDINIPQMNDMALAYSSSSNSQFNGEYDYNSKIEVYTEVVSNLDGQKVGYGTAKYVDEANQKNAQRKNWVEGK